MSRFHHQNLQLIKSLPETSHKTRPSTLLLDSLPTEIQDLIFHEVIRDSIPAELKRFRQSNRYFRDRADIYLFHTLHISANNLSLARLNHIASDDRLNCHVRELVFHRGTFSGHKMVRFGGGHGLQTRDYGDFEEYMVRGHAGYRPLQADLMRVSACYVAFAEEVDSEARFNREMSWQSTVKKCCARFPKLEKLTTLPDHQDLESRYLKARCGLTHQSWTPNYFAPYEIVGACGPAFRPRALSLQSVNGEDFAAIVTFIRGGEAAVRERFAQLRQLTLSFSETVGTLEVEGTYDLFISSCTNLRSLCLDFTSFYSPKILRDPDSFPVKFIKVALQQSFPHLEHLDLTYAPMTEHDFTAFLARHSTTLRTLRLCRWPMPVHPSGAPTGSVIRALWQLGRIPFQRLRSVKLEREFSNRKDGEGWTADADPADNRDTGPIAALYVLEAYLENRGRHAEGQERVIRFPFEIPVDVMEKAKTPQQLLELDELPYKQGWSDCTFEWWEETVSWNGPGRR